MEFKKLEKKVFYYNLFSRLIFFLILVIGLFIGLYYIPEKFKLLFLIPFLFLILISFIRTFILSYYQYKVYEYYYDNEKIIIKKGVIFRNMIAIPILQIQDIELIQGPFQRLFKIAMIDIATAGSVEYINNIDYDLANEIVLEIQNNVNNRLKKDLDYEKIS